MATNLEIIETAGRNAAEILRLERQVEELTILLAWEVGKLSEGQAAILLKTDRVSARSLKQRWINEVSEEIV